MFKSRASVVDLSQRTKAVFFVIDSLNDDLINVLMQGQVEGAVMFVIPGGTEQDPADRLVIYRQAGPGHTPGQTAQVEYGLLKTDSPDGLCRLGRRFARLEASQRQNDKGQVYILADQIRSLRFELFDGNTWYRGSVPAGAVISEVRISMNLPEELWDNESSVISCCLPVGWLVNSAIASGQVGR